MTMKLKRLSAKDLRIDHPLPWHVYDAGENLLLCKGYLVTTDSQIESLLERGMFVDEDVYNRWVADTMPPADMPFNPFEVLDAVQHRLARLLKDIESEPEFVGEIQGLAGQLGSLSQKDADVGISRLLLADADSYVISHHISVALVVQLVAQKLGWSSDEQADAVCAALTMNVGMIGLQSKLFHQREPLSTEQREAVRLHPQRGYELLKAAGVTRQGWLEGVRDHHENRRGKGYPRGANDSSELAELIHLADVYGAKVTRRGYRRAVPANLAARDLFLGEGVEPGNALASLLIKEVGIYPPGAYVQLGNGEVAIVARRGETASAPVVYSLTNARLHPYAEPIKRDTSRNEFKVSRTVPPDSVMVRINPTKIWGYV